MPLASGAPTRFDPAPMQLHLSATPCAARPDGPPRMLAPMDGALLAWLALEGPTPRNRLAALLWPDKPPEAARNSLRQRLFQLRRQFGVELVAGGAAAALADGVSHDLHHADTLLDGVPLEISGEFAQWLDLQRERRRGRVRRSLAELAEMAESAKDWDDALTHARELLALEPLSEEAHRRVIRLHYLAGDPAAAMLAFDRCEQVLKDEVGARPSAETMALLATVQNAELAAELPHAGRVPASLLRPPRLVGRELEWAALEEAWQQRRPLLLLGDGGVGKSRLLDDFGRSKAAILRSGARPGDERVAYATVSRLLRMLPPKHLRSLPQAARNCLASLLPDLGEPIPLHDEADRTRLFNACASALSGAAEGVEVCTIDDLQFADAASVELLRFLADIPALRWFFASRPPSPGQAAFDWVQSLCGTSGVDVVRLQPLAVEDHSELTHRDRAKLTHEWRLPEGAWFCG